MGALVWLACLLGPVLGAALQLQQAELWPGRAYVAVAGASAVGAWVVRQWGPPRRGWVAVGAGVVMAGLMFAWVGWRAVQQAATALPPALEGQVLQVTGRVVDLPQQTPTGWTFLLDTDSVVSGGPAWQGRLRLQWRSEGAVVQRLEAGQRWRLPVRLRAPHGLSNPHGFDAEAWMWESGIQASGHVGTSGAPPQLLEPASVWRVAVWRQWVRDRLQAHVPEARLNGVLTALVVGDQRGIDAPDWDVFRRTGVAHLVSVSGTHITMWAVLATAAVGWAWGWMARWAPGVALRWPRPWVAQWGGLLLAAAYALFSGWSVPAQRTVWMLLVVVWMRTGGWRWPWYMGWLLVMNVVLWLDPWAVLQPGFWLSFVAVGLLFSTQTGADQRDGESRWAPVGTLLRTQVVMTVALTPLSWLWFGQASLVGLLANLLAIPWVTWLLTPLAMAGVIFSPLWQAAAWCLAGGMQVLEVMAQWSWAAWERPALPGGVAALTVLGGALLVWKLPWHWRAWGGVLVWPALVYQPARPAEGAFDVQALDVGQGAAVVVRTAAHTLLFDSGPPAAVERAIVPVLRGSGDRLDGVVISHNDSDHASGLDVLTRFHPRAQWWASFAASAGAPGPRLQPCEAGHTWQWDGVTFRFLHPSPEDGSDRAPDNARSCVLQVQAGGVSALLTGDIGVAQEAQVLRRYPSLQAQWLLAGHHGSHTSNGPLWLQTLQPEWVVVQAGYRNRYRHPAPEVVRRFEALGLRWINTVDCGAARWSSQHPEVMACHRQQTQRYWHHRPDH